MIMLTNLTEKRYKKNAPDAIRRDGGEAHSHDGEDINDHNLMDDSVSNVKMLRLLLLNSHIDSTNVTPILNKDKIELETELSLHHLEIRLFTI